MFEQLKAIFGIKPTDLKKPKKKKPKYWERDYYNLSGDKLTQALDDIQEKIIQKTPDDFKIATPDGATMDSSPTRGDATKSAFSLNPQNAMPVPYLWFGNQGFIGYQNAAIFAQHWLIDKCCSMPGEDAIRNGFDITVNGKVKIEPEVLEEIKQQNIKYGLNKHMLDFVRKGRIFGIRIALFLVTPPPGIEPEEYYAAPFNLDGVTPHSYKGIVQIDPYWITPILDIDSAANPASLDFYEPTWWQVNGIKYHKSHLVIFKNGEPADILQPTYIYGGIPIPQKIYLRVYAAERSADEAPELMVTKRLGVIACDIQQALLKPEAFQRRLNMFAQQRDNYGNYFIDRGDTYAQVDTALADVDAVIMTQFQLVAAAADVPATKLLGTQPKGFNTTGEYEQKSYHEKLESLQNNKLTPLVDRHHALVIKSEIMPTFGTPEFYVTTKWRPLNVPTAKEKEEQNKLKAETGAIYVNSGAINGQDERNRIIADEDSGYNGLEPEAPTEEIEDFEDKDGD